MAATLVTPVPEKFYFGRDAAAEFLEVSTRTIDEAIRAGDLEAFRVGRRVLIRKDSLIKFAERVTA